MGEFSTFELYINNVKNDWPMEIRKTSMGALLKIA